MPLSSRRLCVLVAAATTLGIAPGLCPAPTLAATTGTHPSNVSLASRTNPSVPDQHIILDASVDTPQSMPFATGTVTFADAGSPLMTVPLDGQALVSVSVVLDPNAPYQHHLTAAYSGDTAFAPSTSPEVVEDVVGPVSPSERYVRQLYNDILGRMVDSGFLISELEWGHITRTQAAGALAYSREHVIDVVHATYQGYLGRDADPDGLTYWTGRIMSGLTGTMYPGMPPLATDETLELSFLASPEYVAAAQHNGGLVLSLYHDVLGREPDAGGLDYWTRRFSAGTPPTQLAFLLLFSDESMRNRVTDVYLSILWRDPDPGGLDFWTSRLQHGARDEDLVMLLAGSDEYWQRTQAL